MAGEDEEEEVEVVPSSRWSQLLPELLSQICLQFFGVDVRAFVVMPSVCKSWNNIIATNHPNTLITRSLSNPPLKPLAPEYPCLMTLHDTSCKFYHPSHTFTLDFPELSGSCIQFSKFGWLLLRRFYPNEDDSYTYFFFNPFTREKIELPPYEFGFLSMCFSSPPTCSDCYVVGLEFCGSFGLIRRGERQWNFYALGASNSVPFSHLVLCRDRCYANGSENKILVFDVKKKTAGFIGRPFHVLEKDDNITAKFLVGDGAQLLGVIVSEKEGKINIARRNESKGVWVDISTNLKNKMLFVSKTSSLLVRTNVVAASNKVYFPIILNDNSFVPYCLATKKYISFFGDYSSTTPYNEKIKEWTNCTWIESMPFVVAPSSNQTIYW